MNVFQNNTIFLYVFYYLCKQNIGIWLATELGIYNTFHITIIFTHLY
jgi:hypothetical protein